MSKIEKLLRKYSEIKDDLLDYTDEYHDGMLYDIRGYRYELHDGYEFSDDEIKVLETQVRAFKSILKALKSINYIYG